MMKRRTRTTSLVHGWFALAAFGLIAGGSLGTTASCAPDPICGDDIVNLPVAAGQRPYHVPILIQQIKMHKAGSL